MDKFSLPPVLFVGTVVFTYTLPNLLLLLRSLLCPSHRGTFHLFPKLVLRAKRCKVSALVCMDPSYLSSSSSFRLPPSIHPRGHPLEHPLPLLHPHTDLSTITSPCISHLYSSPFPVSVQSPIPLTEGIPTLMNPLHHRLLRPRSIDEQIRHCYRCAYCQGQ